LTTSLEILLKFQHHLKVGSQHLFQQLVNKLKLLEKETFNLIIKGGKVFYM